MNALLTLITLGIYRFWAKTNIRRFFWRNVSLLDDPLEYTGTGGELFVGFLIVIAVLFPLGLIYGAINTLVPPHHPEMHIALEATYYIVLFALLRVAVFAACGSIFFLAPSTMPRLLSPLAPRGASRSRNLRLKGQNRRTSPIQARAKRHKPCKV